MMEATIIDNLSVNADSFAAKYKSDLNFIQRYKKWTDTIDKYSKGAVQAYDIGCGAGIFSFYLASKGIRTTGYDGAKGMVDLCNRIKKENHVSKAEFRLEMIPLPTGVVLPQADLVISSSVIEYIENPGATIEMLNRLLKPNGKLIVSFPNRDATYRKIEMSMFRIFRKPGYFRYVKNVWDKSQAEKIFGNYGFSLIEYFYFSNRSLVSRIAGMIGGERRSGNLTMMIFEKIK